MGPYPDDPIISYRPWSCSARVRALVRERELSPKQKLGLERGLVRDVAPLSALAEQVEAEW